jgi:hypothetical protein
MGTPECLAGSRFFLQGILMKAPTMLSPRSFQHIVDLLHVLDFANEYACRHLDCLYDLRVTEKPSRANVLTGIFVLLYAPKFAPNLSQSSWDYSIDCHYELLDYLASVRTSPVEFGVYVEPSALAVIDEFVFQIGIRGEIEDVKPEEHNMFGVGPFLYSVEKALRGLGIHVFDTAYDIGRILAHVLEERDERPDWVTNLDGGSQILETLQTDRQVQKTMLVNLQPFMSWLSQQISIKDVRRVRAELALEVGRATITLRRVADRLSDRSNSPTGMAWNRTTPFAKPWPPSAI